QDEADLGWGVDRARRTIGQDGGESAMAVDDHTAMRSLPIGDLAEGLVVTYHHTEAKKLGGEDELGGRGQSIEWHGGKTGGKTTEEASDFHQGIGDGDADPLALAYQLRASDPPMGGSGSQIHTGQS